MLKKQSYQSLKLHETFKSPNILEKSNADEFLFKQKFLFQNSHKKGNCKIIVKVKIIGVKSEFYSTSLSDNDKFEKYPKRFKNLSI